MKNFFTLLLLFLGGGYAAQVNAQGVYQIPNSDFESWARDNEPGNGWNSFASAGGSMNYAASLSPAPTKVTGYQGGTAVKLTSKTVIIAKANGNLTTGRINMGNMSPSNKANFNHTDLTSTQHALVFAGTPDSVECYATFKSGGSPNGRGLFILHDKYDYKDPETSNDAGYESHKIGSAAIVITPCTTWTRFVAAFTYTGIEKPSEQYMLASFTTNPTPGGSVNDELVIDKVRLIYNSELTSLSYDGKDIFEEGKTAYNLSGQDFDPQKLAYTCNGKGATVEIQQDMFGLVTLTVKGNDWSDSNKNEHVYTIQFASNVASTTKFSNTLLVNVAGTVSEPTTKTIDLLSMKDGSTALAIYDFVFSGIPVGDIIVTNLNKEETDNGTIYTGKQTITVLGLPAEVDVTATVKDGKMTAIIPIDVTGVGKVFVTFAPSLVIDGAQDAVTETDGLYNVTFNRAFPAGWSTICLPYATTVTALGAEQVQEFIGFDGKTLSFQKVESGELAAHTPYLIYFAAEKPASTTPWFYVDNVTAGKPEAVTHGNVTFCGNYTANKSMEGLYGVADKEGEQYIMRGGANSTLGSTGAFFTVSGTEANALRIKLDVNPTGIDEITAGGNGQPFDVYSLSGVKVRSHATTTDGLPQGIYIINGKKYIVK